MNMQMNHQYASVLGIEVANMIWPEAMESVARKLYDDDKQHVFSFLNANNANISIGDKAYLDSIKNTTILPDGFGVDIANVMHNGRKFAANLNGTDFIPSLMVYLDQPLTIALLGGSQSSLDKATCEFRENTPWHTFVPISNGYMDEQGTEAALNKLEKLKPDILLVAMGSPLQEKWVTQHVKPEHGKLVFTVGALFDFVSQNVRRAPVNWRQWRLEWLYRLIVEPRRLWRRYVIGNPLFLLRVFWHHVVLRKLGYLERKSK